LADEEPDVGRHQKGAWIAAGAAIVAALIAALVPVLASSGDDDKGDKPVDPITVTVVAPTPSASAPTSPSAPAATTRRPTTPVPSKTDPPAPPSTSLVVTQLWKGALLLDTEPKDLDAAPPEPVGYSYNGDVYIELNHELMSSNGTLVARWSGGALPGYADCSTAVGALGSRQPMKLSTRTVLCVRTSEQNIARLKVTSVATGLDVKTTFDVVIWTAG
jgi:hypothetical protein